MSETDAAIKKRVEFVLSAKSWRCRICDERIDTNLKSQDEKESVLNAHLNDKHLSGKFQSLFINKDIPDRYRVGYFKPIIENIQGNVKTIS